MNKIEGEQISALVDGEVEPEAFRNTVSRLLDAGPDALDTYGRYRLIGELLRDESAQVVHVSDDVRSALRDEPTVLVPPPPSPWRWWKPVAGVAVAASVATAAVVIAPQMIPGLQPGTQVIPVMTDVPRPQPITQLVASQPSRLDDASGLSGSPRNSRWHTLDPKLEERLNRLIIEHHEYAGRTGLHGPVPHLGVASYEAR